MTDRQPDTRSELQLQLFQPAPAHASEPGRELLHIGYIPSIFVFFPLPYRDPGQQFSKTVRGYRIDLMSRIGCPYGKIGRSVLSLITTEAVTKKTPYIELGSLRSTLAKMSVACSGGKTGSALRTSEQFHRIANTQVNLEHQVNNFAVKGIDEAHFTFASNLSLRWSKLHPSGPLGPENYLQLTAECYEYIIAHSVPMLLEPYFSIQSPREQDLLAWLSRRLWNLNTETIVKWESLYEQFGPVVRQKKPQFRNELSAYLYHIRTEIYPQAQVERTSEGLILRPSPPLIDPSDRRAGHLL